MLEPTLFDLNAMQRRLAALEAERAYLFGLIAAAQAYQNAVAQHQPYMTITAHSSYQVATPKPKRSAPVMEATEDLAAELMEDAKGPVSTAAIVEAMRERDMPVPAKNPQNVISARLSNSPRFVGRRGRGWWFADRPWPGDDVFQASLEIPDEAESKTATDQ